MLGMQDLNADEMTKRLDEMLDTIRNVNIQFKNPVSPLHFFLIFFICCISNILT